MKTIQATVIILLLLAGCKHSQKAASGKAESHDLKAMIKGLPVLPADGGNYMIASGMGDKRCLQVEGDGDQIPPFPFVFEICHPEYPGQHFAVHAGADLPAGGGWAPSSPAPPGTFYITDNMGGEICHDAPSSIDAPQIAGCGTEAEWQQSEFDIDTETPTGRAMWQMTKANS
jgi:hypothetical protein